jgi:hypothetical protein
MGSFDHWTWPYPVAGRQQDYEYMTFWDGNQLPSFFKNPSGVQSFGWMLQTSQQLQEFQRQGDKANTGMGAIATGDILDWYFAQSRTMEGIV